MKAEVHIAKAIIMNEQNDVLFTQRPTNHKRTPNAWTTPAGHIEAGENAKQAVLREIKEEVDLDVNVLAELGIDKKLAPENPHRVILSHYFLCKSHTLKISLQKEEFQTYDWVPLIFAKDDSRISTSVKDMIKKASELPNKTA